MEEEEEEKEKKTEKENMIQEDGVVEGVQRLDQEVLLKRRGGQTRKGGREDEGEEKKNRVEYGENGKIVLPGDDRAKFDGSKCGVGKCPELRRTDGGDARKKNITERLCVEHGEEVLAKVQGTFDIFFGVERRMRKEEMEEQFNQEAKTRLETCSRRSEDHRRRKQAVRIASTRREESL